MAPHFSQVICPFRGYFVNYGSPMDSGWADERCVGPKCAKWAGGLTHHRDGTESPAGFCAMGQASQPLVAGDPPKRR